MAAFAAALAAAAIQAQSQPCDPLLVPSTSDPYTYRLRGDRCEGTYAQQVAGTPLAIVSWTQSFPAYDLNRRQPLHLEWESPGNNLGVRLRAQSLRRRLYYQMDALRQAGIKFYDWPVDLLAALALPKEELAVTAIERATVGEAERDVYLPLRIGQGSAAGSPGGYQLVLLPGTELKEVFITLSETEGRKSVIRKAEPLGYGFYPAERPIDVPVAPPRERGIYRLEIGATLKNGGASAAELWFYHAGNAK